MTKALCGKSLISYPGDEAELDDRVVSGKTCETCLKIARSHPKKAAKGYVKPRQGWSWHIRRLA